MAVLRALQGDTLDQMVWRHYGSADEELVDAVRDYIDNKGLSDLGPVLPQGTPVTMPEGLTSTIIEESTLLPEVDLWD